MFHFETCKTQTLWSTYTFPEKNFLKQSSSLPRFSLTTANRGTSRSCSWDLREESSAASFNVEMTDGRRESSFFNNYNACVTFHTSLHNNHPGRRTTMITPPVFSHRDFALYLSWTEKHSAVEITVHMKDTMLVIIIIIFFFLLVCDSLPPVVFNSVFPRTSWLAHSGLVWNQSVTLLTSSAKYRITTFKTASTVDMSVDLLHGQPDEKNHETIKNTEGNPNVSNTNLPRLACMFTTQSKYSIPLDLQEAQYQLCNSSTSKQIICVFK